MGQKSGMNDESALGIQGGIEKAIWCQNTEVILVS